MLEAFICGTPVIAFPVGGLAEHVKNGINGLLAKDISPDSLANAISTFVLSSDTYQTEQIKSYAEEHFSLKKVSIEYIKVYRDILN
jgi:glycosyltransferase involved in cell wall biosynthesis